MIISCKLNREISAAALNFAIFHDRIFYWRNTLMLLNGGALNEIDIFN